MSEFLLFFLAGAIGSLVRLVSDNGCLVLPRRVNGTLVLGFIGSMVVGGFIGCIVDGEFFVSALGGYVGVDVLDRYVANFGAGRVSEKVIEEVES